MFSYRGFEFKSLMQILLFLAGAVGEIERDLRIPLYLSNTSPLSRRNRCGVDITADRDGYRGMVRCDFGSLDSLTLQTFSLGIGSLVFHYWSGAVDFLAHARITFWITANREKGQFHVWCAGGLNTQAKPV